MEDGEFLAGIEFYRVMGCARLDPLRALPRDILEEFTKLRHFKSLIRKANKLKVINSSVSNNNGAVNMLRPSSRIDDDDDEEDEEEDEEEVSERERDPLVSPRLKLTLLHPNPNKRRRISTSKKKKKRRRRKPRKSCFRLIR